MAPSSRRQRWWTRSLRQAPRLSPRAQARPERTGNRDNRLTTLMPSCGGSSSRYGCSIRRSGQGRSWWERSDCCMAIWTTGCAGTGAAPGDAASLRRRPPSRRGTALRAWLPGLKSCDPMRGRPCYAGAAAAESRCPHARRRCTDRSALRRADRRFAPRAEHSRETVRHPGVTARCGRELRCDDCQRAAHRARRRVAGIARPGSDNRSRDRRDPRRRARPDALRRPTTPRSGEAARHR